MRRVPGWLVSMFAGLLGVALLGALGAPSLVALLVGIAVGLAAHRSRRDPPWTAAGRRRWREAWRGAGTRIASLRRWWSALARGRGGRFGGPFGDAGRAQPPGGWPGGPGSAWGEGSDGEPGSEEDADEPGAGGHVTVRCELVTGRFQVWHSTDTGRPYEVPTERGLAGAAPGDIGTLRFEGGRPRIVPRTVN
jgi:hypothetical protein